MHQCLITIVSCSAVRVACVGCWGKRREMRHARCEGLQYGLPVSLLACWAFCRLTYPRKPPCVGCATR